MATLAPAAASASAAAKPIPLVAPVISICLRTTCPQTILQAAVPGLAAEAVDRNRTPPCLHKVTRCIAFSATQGYVSCISERTSRILPLEDRDRGFVHAFSQVFAVRKGLGLPCPVCSPACPL